MNVTINRITATKPSRLSKHYYLDGGELAKDAGGALTRGQVEPVEIGSLRAFADELRDLTPAQALTYGGPGHAATLVTKQAFAEAGRPEGMVPRARSHFHWPAGGGVLLLDYDPRGGEAAMGRDDLVSAIRTAAPGLADATMVWWPSSSSHIVHGETGEDLTGLRGQRLYILVAAASDIPRAGAVLAERLWLTGYGRFDVSASGALLERTLVDATVWQPERLDFAAGASCAAPLRQDRGEPVIVSGTTEIVDTTAALPDLDASERERVTAAKASSRAAMKAEAEAARERWIEQRIGELAGDNADREQKAEARAIVERAIDYGVLSGDYSIPVIVDGETRPKAVGTILDDPAAWHGLLTLDPIEPQYDGGRTVGKLFVVGSRPCLPSFAHGGRTYRLERAPSWVEVVKGDPHTTAERALERLRREPDWFDHGDQLVRVENRRIIPMTKHLVWMYLSASTRFFRWKKVERGFERDPVDPPLSVCTAILDMGAARRLKPLEAVISAPTMRADGTVLQQTGYDEATGLLYEPADDPPTIPEHPKPVEVTRALNSLWWPFHKFPFDGAVSRGVFLASVLTSVCRAALPTAPAFGFDAPTQGSGKTLLASCVAALGTGSDPAVWPHTSAADDEEVRKRLFTVLRDGDRAVVWDNIVSSFNSASFAALLTKQSWSDRVLGRSETTTVPNRALFLLTGNNLTLTGDLARRVAVSRIDPECAAPYMREFRMDPMAYVLERRQELVAAALTLIRGYLTSGDARASGRTASFETWDDLVRQTVIWIGRRHGKPGEDGFADPMRALEDNHAEDPEVDVTATLLGSLRHHFGDEAFVAKDVVDVLAKADGGWATDSEQELADSLREIVGRRDLSSKSVGRVIQFRRDRIVDNMKLQGLPPIGRKHRWRVVEVADEAA